MMYFCPRSRGSQRQRSILSRMRFARAVDLLVFLIAGFQSTAAKKEVVGRIAQVCCLDATLLNYLIKAARLPFPPSGRLFSGDSRSLTTHSGVNHLCDIKS